MNERPYIHLSEERWAAVETDGWDDLGLIVERVQGHHALFACRLTKMPAYDDRVKARGLSWREWAGEVAAGQVRFLSAWQPELAPLPGFVNPVLRTFELRFVGGERAESRGIWLLGKAFDPDPDRARMRALALHDEAGALFPFEYGLRAAMTRADFARCRPFGDDPTPDDGGNGGWWVLELRRAVTALPWAKDLGRACVLHPITLDVQGLKRTLQVMAAFRGTAVLSVGLRPTRLLEPEARRLEALRRGLRYRRNSPGPGWRAATPVVPGQFYLLRVRLAGYGAEPEPLARALGADLFGGRGGGHYSLAQPDPKHPDWLATAWENLRWLEFDAWGREEPLPPAGRRLRYLAGVHEAGAAFRVPPLSPEEGATWGLGVG